MDIIKDFESRKKEIEEYFSFLEKIENDYPFLASNNNSSQKDNFIYINNDLQKIFKANGILLLYNLIESTIFNSIVKIFDQIETSKISYKNVSDELKIYWLKNTYKYDEKISEEKLSRDKIYKIIDKVINNNINWAINRIQYGGSLDARKIEEISNELNIGFINDTYDKNIHGEIFVKIKEYRNKLAHGSKSFSDVGKNLVYESKDATGLSKYMEYTIEHLSKFIESVENYIKNESYKKK